MQRAPCAASSSTGLSTRNSLRSRARSVASRYFTPERSIFRKAPSSPTDEPLPTRRHRVGGALELLARPRLEQALVVAREDLDELRAQRLELVEHPLADGRAGAAHVLADEVVQLDSAGVVAHPEP